MSAADRFDLGKPMRVLQLSPTDETIPTPAELYERRQRLARNRAQAYRARLHGR